MYNWYWLICPKCGCPNDSDLYDINKDKTFYTKEDFKKQFGSIKVDCMCEAELSGHDCDFEYLINDCVVIGDKELK